ncbi:MAG: PQQ-binding-like beta-propeller repeat protein [Verrucomicrobiae bacterium]|nr:PQQ-binding-like beta-propeller repeat protein [Verrucomicrobiae bacterium]
MAAGLAALCVLWILGRHLSFQYRNLAVGAVGLLVLTALLLWWMLFSRARWPQRWLGLAWVAGGIGLGLALFRIRGVSGDFVPIWEPRWARSAPSRSAPAPSATPAEPAGTNAMAAAGAFPQFLGPQRNAVLPGPVLATNWSVQPPQILWRQPLGAAWSGFAVVGDQALTQEQHGPEEQVTCYEASTGRHLWTHSDPERYATTIAGEGPRATPTVVGDRVFTLGALGRLNALDLATGRRLWTRSLTNDAATGVPEWGFSGSPLVQDGLVIVSAGGRQGASLVAYRADTGEIAWTGGSSEAGYASPFFATLSGTPQILIVNRRSIASHDPRTGAVLWEVPFGAGMPLPANPILIPPDRLMVSAGYNVGSELFAVAPGTNAPSSLWKSKKLKAKFANPVFRDGFVYGLDDSILACLDARDGSQRWKEGRYGHGQALLVGDLYLQMAESGELILLAPTPDAPNEITRFPVFTAKTWNPIALRGHQLFARNDQEAALVLLP